MHRAFLRVPHPDKEKPLPDDTGQELDGSPQDHEAGLDQVTPRGEPVLPRRCTRHGQTTHRTAGDDHQVLDEVRDLVERLLDGTVSSLEDLCGTNADGDDQEDEGH
ncbi:MAG TPA: hypothetical protein VFZ48_02330, partial [Candidatus Saccharimonadales bacterium]